MTLLAGSLAELDLVDLAEVTSLGRTCLRLEVSGADDAPLGFLVLKGGRVVEARTGDSQGRAALHTILNAATGARFRLVRETAPPPATAALARVEDLPRRPRSPSRTAGSAAAAVPRPAAPDPSTRQGVFRRPARPTGSGPVAQPTRLAAGTGARIRMMEGRLDEFDLGSLLQVIGMGRSFIELEVLSERGEQVGSVWIKSGKVVSARAGHIEGMAAISQLLHTRDGFQFAAFRVEADLRHATALADLADVLGPAPAPANDPYPRAPIMEGSLSDFDVPTLLQTAAASRQYCELELWRDQRKLGVVRIKAGVVVSAATGTATGLPALRLLVELTAPHWFRLTRLTEPVGSAPPLGALARLLLELPERGQPLALGTDGTDGTDAADGVAADGAAADGAAGAYDARRDEATFAGSRRAQRTAASVAQVFSRETRRALPDARELVGAVTAEATAEAPRAPEQSAPPSRSTYKALPPVPAAATARPHGGELVPLLDGTLLDFELRALLEVLAMTRQHSRLLLIDGRDHIVGELRLKAGYVLSARTGDLEGAEAVRAMLALPRAYRFRVLGDLTSVSSEWLGSISGLLAAAAVRGADPPPRSSRALWLAIPLSFAVGGALVLLLWGRDARPRGAPLTAPPGTAAAATTGAATGSTATNRDATTPARPAAPASSATTTRPAAHETKDAGDAPKDETGEPRPQGGVAGAAPASAGGPPAPSDDAPAPEAIADRGAEGQASPTEGAEGSREAPLESLTGQSVRNAQRALRRLGYDPGPADNRYGKRTRAALVSFQERHGLPLTGTLTRDTWSAIVAELTAR